MEYYETIKTEINEHKEILLMIKDYLLSSIGDSIDAEQIICKIAEFEIKANNLSKPILQMKEL